MMFPNHPRYDRRRVCGQGPLTPRRSPIGAAVAGLEVGRHKINQRLLARNPLSPNDRLLNRTAILASRGTFGNGDLKSCVG